MADTPQIIELTDENFAASINDHPFAVVDFWAPWCAPCRAFAPVFAAAAVKYPDVRFAKVNTEEQQQLAGHFNIRSIPTLMIFRDNIIVFAEAGALPASALDQVLTAARALDMEAVRREIDTQAEAPAETPAAEGS
jgi:thioredoxin 1